MPDTRDPRAVVEAAEQAAAAGDYASAEQLLREAASLQEAALGPLHPDLANTLNNLAVVCEITDKPADAERCFRRAYAIATAALDPDHPFVATSRKNLEDFCAARGKTIDTPTAPPAVDVSVEVHPPVPRVVDVPAAVRPPAPPVVDVPAAVRPPAPPVVDIPAAVRPPAPPVVDVPAAVRPPAPPAVVAPKRSTSVAPPPDVARSSSRPFVIGVLAVGLLVAFLLSGSWFRSRETGASSTATSGASPVVSPPPAPAPAPVEPKPVVPEPAIAKPADPSRLAPPPLASKPTVVADANATPGTRPATAGRPTATSVGKAPPIVVDLQLCKDGRTSGPVAGGWQCDSASSPVAPGRLLFYTRLKSPADTTVQHRWYRGARLHQSVELPIRANMGTGYRTYSRNTVGASGDWRVELRTRDGVLLHEERFTVR
jgi:hypothetical protein